MANKKPSEKVLMRDIERLLNKHDLPNGKTTISVAPIGDTGAVGVAESVQCTPPQKPHQISVTLANGQIVVMTICK